MSNNQPERGKSHMRWFFPVIMALLAVVAGILAYCNSESIARQILLGVCFAFVVAAISYLLLCGDKRERMNWWITITATLISFALAFSGALLLYRSQESDNNRQRIEVYRVSLKNELDYIKSRLERTKLMIVRPEDDPLPTRVVYLPCRILEDAGASGLYPDTASGNLLEAASRVREYNLDTEYLLATMTTGRIDDSYWNRIEFAVEQWDRDKEEVDKSFDKVREVLGLPEEQQK